MNFSYSLTENVRRFPEKIAVVHGDTRLSYRELDERVSSIAHELRAAGVVRGSRVAVLLWNCAEFVEAYYACLRLGAICVPLNYRLAAEELRYELGHSASSVLFTEQRFHATVDSVLDQLPELRLLVTTAATAPSGWRRHGDLAAHPGVVVADEPVAMDDVQRIMYTSGTTARPKAAMTTHGQVCWGAVTRALEFGLSSADVSLTVGPLYHVGALDTFTTPMLYLGGTVVIHSRFDPREAVRAIADHRITNCWMAPTMLNMIFQLPDVTSYGTDSLRVVIGGGEKAPLPLLERLARDWPTVGFYDVYGLTECQGLATHLSPERARDKAGSVGLPTRGRELRIVDEEDRDVEPGQPGEVLVRGPVVFPGYFDAPEATAETLRDGWLHTGDVARRDDEGFVYIVDRKKDMILSGAENIAPAEIERVIDELPEVLEVAVVAMPDDRWGEVPVAFVAARDGQRIDVDAVSAHCTTRLAGFKVPRTVTVVEALPRTPSGKVLKRALREQLPTG